MALSAKAQIGAENVFDFSLGNPSVPAPAVVAESVKALELPSDQLHGYTPHRVCRNVEQPLPTRSTAALAARVMRARTSL